jgi:hypothetical protein
MTQHEYMKARDALFLAFNHCAPNGKVQAAFSSMVNEVEADRTGDSPNYRGMMRQYVGTLYDGLAYGNWIGQL